MPRSIPRDPKLYAEAVERVRAGARHRIVQETVDWSSNTADCQACGRNVKVYQSNSFAVCANYYVDRLVRQQLIDQGERVPKIKRGRMAKDEVQVPVRHIGVVEQYLPWDHRPVDQLPIGFDRSRFHGNAQLTDKIDTYLDAQAAHQGNQCFMCAAPLKMLKVGGHTQMRDWGFARIRMPSGHQQVVIMDEVFCSRCVTKIEQHGGMHPAVVLRLAQVLAHGQHLKPTGMLSRPLASPVEQQELLERHL